MPKRATTQSDTPDTIREVLELCDQRPQSKNAPIFKTINGFFYFWIALLLDRKADPDLSCRFGVTAAHQACTFGQVKCLQLLIARRANINARAVDGRTPLDLARMSGHSECVELLLFFFFFIFFLRK